MESIGGSLIPSVGIRKRAVSTIVQRLECIKKQKKLVEKQLEELKDYAELLDYKEWYYEMAAAAGTTEIQTNCIIAKRIMPRIIK
ncbi:MAG: hypothetical protein LBK08_00060 [Treponema sp.]|jgi:hypothetical protein|nr:hypothetical protein [Treponema sp.]